MKEGIHQTLSGKCVDLSFEGKGVFKSKDKTVFVPGMFIGDEGEIEVTYSRGGALFGKIKKLTVLSKDRINPLCKVCSACGGCSFQAYKYEAQLLYKQNKVKEQFRKIAKLDVKVNQTVGMDDPFYYRNKIQMPFGKDNRGNVYCGFYKEGTHVLVPVEECYIEDKRAKHILDELKRLFKEFRIEPYQEDRGYGVIRHALIRTSHYKNEIMLVLVTAIDSFPGRNNLVKAIIKNCPEVTTVVQNINSRHTNVILGDRERVLYGKGFIQDSLCGLTFKISAKSFYQTNPVMTEKLYEAAMKEANLTKDDIVFDAYSGIGTIGLIASRYCKHVISVELVKEAVRDAIKNARDNGINNFEVVCDDASSYINRLAKQKVKIDVLFMDPPRKGSDDRFLKAVMSLKPNRVVYISCDPSSLARDIAKLKRDYEISSITPFDMFPNTSHVETVCLLLRRQQ